MYTAAHKACLWLRVGVVYFSVLFSTSSLASKQDNDTSNLNDNNYHYHQNAIIILKERLAFSEHDFTACQLALDDLKTEQSSYNSTIAVLNVVKHNWVLNKSSQAELDAMEVTAKQALEAYQMAFVWYNQTCNSEAVEEEAESSVK